MAKQMVQDLNLKRIDLDEVKFNLFGKDIIDKNLKQEDWDKVYQKMYQTIEKDIKGGVSLVHDTGNFTKYERGLIRKIAEKAGNTRIVTIFVDTPYETAKQRLLENRNKKHRFNVSDQAFESAVAEMEKPGEDENVLIYDTKIPASEWIKKNLHLAGVTL